MLGYNRVLEKRFGGPGKSWKSPEIFCKQESGNPVFTVMRDCVGFIMDLTILVEMNIGSSNLLNACHCVPVQFSALLILLLVLSRLPLNKFSGVLRNT